MKLELQEQDGTSLKDQFPFTEISIAKGSAVLVRLDVHKETMVAAYSVGFGEISSLGNVGIRGGDIDPLCTSMQSKASRAVFVYEAGACGCQLQCYLSRNGFECRACPPSLTAKKPGDRVKTDWRDAEKLVKALRGEDLSRAGPERLMKINGKDVAFWWSNAHDEHRAKPFAQ